jgi:hypothetical protein
MTVSDIDLAAIMAEHGDHWDNGSGYCGDPRCTDEYLGHCEPYRLAEALAAEQARVSRVIELCVEWEQIDSACWADAQEVRAALADQPEDVSP